MFATIRLWLYGIGTGLLMLAGVWLYRLGIKTAVADVKEDDYEHAKDIRRRVSVDRADRVRQLDDAGWRD